MEIGHLIDGLELVGLDGFAQTDLGSVVHRNRGLRESLPPPPCRRP
jgi:hypothetical protein